MLDERTRDTRPAILLLVALAALGWICAFYALWLDAGHRLSARSEIARLQAENTMLREALAPISDLAERETEPSRRVAHGGRPERTGAIVVAEATPHDFAERDRLSREWQRLASAEEAVNARLARAATEESDAAERRQAQEAAVQALETYVLDLRDDLLRLETQIRDAQRDLADLERARDERREAADLLAADIARAEAENEVAARSLEDTRAALAQTEETLTELRSELADAEERIGLREAALQSLEERLARAARAVRAAEAEAVAAATPPPPPPAAAPAPPPAAPAAAPRVETRPDGLQIIRVPARP